MEKSEILQMALATIESKDKRIEKLKKDKQFFSEQWEKQSKENTELKECIKEACNLLNKCNSNDANIDRAMELLNKYN